MTRALAVMPVCILFSCFFSGPSNSPRRGLALRYRPGGNAVRVGCCERLFPPGEAKSVGGPWGGKSAVPIHRCCIVIGMPNPCADVLMRCYSWYVIQLYKKNTQKTTQGHQWVAVQCWAAEPFAFWLAVLGWRALAACRH